MDIQTPPQSFGVFKPVGHTVVAFSSAKALEAAVSALLADGPFIEADLTRYSTAQMLAQTASDLQTASPLASIGQELNLVKAHRALAEQGCVFLVVHAADDEHIAKLTAVAKAAGARAAQHYGNFVIEELVAVNDGSLQLFESPDTGLDLKPLKS